MRNEVYQADLPELPATLQKALDKLKPFFKSDPHQLGGYLPSHKLTGKLAGFRAAEIDWGLRESYRLVYRIQDKPAPRTVWIYSFAEHDLAYERAQLRRKRR